MLVEKGHLSFYSTKGNKNCEKHLTNDQMRSNENFKSEHFMVIIVVVSLLGSFVNSLPNTTQHEHSAHTASQRTATQLHNYTNTDTQTRRYHTSDSGPNRSMPRTRIRLRHRRTASALMSSPNSDVQRRRHRRPRIDKHESNACVIPLKRK